MRTLNLFSFLLVTSFAIFCSCTSSNNIYQDKYVIIKSENEAGLNFTKLKGQEEFLNKHRVTRGLLDGYLISLAADGIKRMIDNRHEKYTAQFNMAVSDLRFYNNLSSNGAFDPNGIKFNGFSLVRVVRNVTNNKEDTAFIADFELDTKNPYDILNNSIFKLRLKNLDYRYSKAKMKNDRSAINLDFEITFTTSYVNELGNFFNNVVLGKFYLGLRDAPVNKRRPGYKEYYASLENIPLAGKSFIVPRSFGYYVTNSNQLGKSYSWGNYAISAVVTESSDESFVDKVIYDNTGFILDVAEDKMHKTSRKLIPLFKKRSKNRHNKSDE